MFVTAGGGGCFGYLVGIEARNVAKHPVMYWTEAPHNKELISSAVVENLKPSVFEERERTGR